jgi:Uma2 family endonuclease
VSVATTVPLSEYLHTSYEPDCDYVDGELVKRNVGEAEHSLLQIALGAWLFNNRKRLGITAYTEQRVQVKATRFRIPDITVMAGRGPETGIIRQPPFLCIEVLSPEDRFPRVLERVSDFLEFGVRYVWVIDPATKLATIYTQDGAREVRDGILTTKDPDIVVNLNELDPD